MSKLRKRLKEIEKLAGVAIEGAEVVGSGHVKLTIKGSKHRITISTSPSCPFANKHAAGDIRRAMGKTKG